MKRIITAILVLLLLFGGTPSVSAMTGTRTQWDGVQQAGVMPVDTDCPLEVKHMLLTFDLQNFANPYTSSEEELLAYTGKVTTEYIFYNPTDTVITTQLMLYLGYHSMPENLYDMDIDKYEIFVNGEAVEKALCSNESNPSGVYPYVHYDSTLWYVYEITLQPGQELINTVTAPIYPSVYINYEPQKYWYGYELSPDFLWQSSGTLDVIVNTPFYLLDCAHEYEKTDTGYKASYDISSIWATSFSLCTSENPEEVESGSNITWLLVLLLIYSEIVHAFNAIGEFFTNIFQFLF